MKLHEDKELFNTAVSSTAQSMNLPEVYIEKDYWVTRALKQLAESEVSGSVVFKGGTSLSKAHRLIHRFSEDIDLAAIDTGLGDAKRKRLLKLAEAIVSGGLTPLPNDERNSKGSKFRKTVYEYPRTGSEENFGQASPQLLVEVNTFTRPEPSERMPIQSMIADMLITQGREDLVDQFGLHSFELNVLSVHRTLIEKLLGIIKDSYFDDPVARLNTRIRHLYDICMIMQDEQNIAFVNGSSFSELCKNCIADEIASWGEAETACLKKPLHEAPIFHRFDEWWPAMEATYRNDFSGLVYGELPAVEKIRETIGILHHALQKIE